MPVKLPAAGAAIPIVVLSLILLACSRPATPNPTASTAAGVGQSADVEVSAIVAEACSDTTYENCAESMTTALNVFAGSLVAVCEYADGTGDVVLVDSEDEAEARCSGEGLISPSRAVTVVQLP